MDKNNIFKLIIAGDGGVGKTTFVMRHLTGQFIQKYIATLGVTVHPLKFQTNKGPMRFNVWDTAGRFGGLRDGYYVQGQCAIVMFDVHSKTSLTNAENWIRDIQRVCGKIPIVLVGTKCDIDVNNKVSNADIRKVMGEFSVKYYEISSLTNYNFEKPFVELIRQLLSDNDINFGPQIQDTVEQTVEQTPIMAVEQELESKDEKIGKTGFWSWFGY